MNNVVSIRKMVRTQFEPIEWVKRVTPANDEDIAHE